MNKKYLLIYFLAFLGLISCSNDAGLDDNVAKEKNTQTDTLTEFVMEEVTPKLTTLAASSRTTFTYDDSNLTPYWVGGDEIWLKMPSSTLIKSVSSDINQRLSEQHTDKTAEAKFYFKAALNASSYPVRYTNKNGANEGNTVEIKSAQSQSAANDPSHLGKDGDCGIATATLIPNTGRYKFQLKHAAAYLTFIPFCSTEQLDGVNITSIEVEVVGGQAGKSLVGTYVLDDSEGVKDGNGGNKATLTLGNNGFELPMTTDANKNASFMVVHPGTYSKLAVTYKLKDTKVGTIGSYTVVNKDVTLNAGDNLVLKDDLKMKSYTTMSTRYFEWDAVDNYLKSHENTNVYIPGVRADFPIASSKNSTKNTERTNFLNAATNSCSNAKGIPTLYELSWYIVKGDPHYDENVTWIYHNHIYNGGLYLLKKSKIQGFSNSPAPGITNAHINTDVVAEFYKQAPASGRPTGNIKDYFFIPALGGYESIVAYEAGGTGRRLDGLGSWVGCWTASGFSGAPRYNYAASNVGAGMLYASKSEITLWSSSYRDWGYLVLPLNKM